MLGRRTWLKTFALGGVLLTGGAVPGLAVERVTVPTKKEVKQLIATAKTREDHLRVAAYYRLEAQRLEAEAKDHQEMGDAYFRDPVRQPVPKHPTMGEHCRDLSGHYQAAMKKALALAELHEQMAKEAK
jgi:hypothetical protein